MRIQVFAILKEHFEREFEVPEQIESITDLKKYLLSLNPAAAKILNSCRFAVADSFVDEHYRLTKNDNIAIIPPSSGG